MSEQYDNLQGSEQDAKEHPNTNLEHPEPGPGAPVRSFGAQRAKDAIDSIPGKIGGALRDTIFAGGTKTPYNTRNAF